MSLIVISDWSLIKPYPNRAPSINNGILYCLHTLESVSNSDLEYRVPYSVGCEMYTIPGNTIWSF